LQSAIRQVIVEPARGQQEEARRGSSSSRIRRTRATSGSRPWRTRKGGRARAIAQQSSVGYGQPPAQSAWRPRRPSSRPSKLLWRDSS